MYKTLKAFLFMTILSISLTACFDYKDVEIKDIKSIKLLDFSNKGLSVESEIKIYNPNNFKLSVVDSEFNFYVKGKKLGIASIEGNLKIPANSEEYYTVVLRSSNKDMSPNAIPMLIGITASGKDNIDFKIEGYIVGKAFLLKRKIEVSHSGKVPLKLF